MELVVIGGSGTYPRPGGACNSYLVRLGEQRLLVDLGPGSLSRLFTIQDPADVRAIFISHLHPDHFIDIYPLRYYLQFSAAQEKLPITVYAPAGAKEKISPLFSDKNKSSFESVFNWEALEDGKSLKLGKFLVTPYEVPHLDPTFSLLIESDNDGSLYYTADTAYNEKLVEIASRSDLLLCEATLKREDIGTVAHLSGSQAGEIGNKAHVKQLVLTHLWPHYDGQDILKEAKKEYRGRVELAQDGKVFTV